jgi:hypothetical protein
MRIIDLYEDDQQKKITKVVVIYPGRFHPFHIGHGKVYKHLASKFSDVYIASSGKVDMSSGSPFTFDEKKQMMMHAGVPSSAIVQVKSPYQATEITSKYDPETTAVIFAVSQKDMNTDPRFQFKPKKDGSPSYYQPMGPLQPLSQHGHIMTVPTFDFNVLGEPMRSASEFRKNFANADLKTQAQMIVDLYGKYDKSIHRIMHTKLS